jgi:AraC-like DNA-binding protein
MTTFLHLQAGLFAYFGPIQDNDWHQHHAIQLIWPAVESSLEIESDLIRNSTALVSSDVKHQLKMQSGWVILIEPQSALGEALAQKLIINGVCQFRSIQVFAGSEADISMDALLPLWQELGIDCQLLAQRPVVDGRIQTLLAKLDTCLAADCIKPESWKAAQVAQELAMSESRFLHLFKQEMQIPWRPYLLWRRLLCAVNALRHGRSATDAAHIAGFSDSAHLSRTFRNHFGLTIRQASRALNNS